MATERWSRIEELFQAALQRPTKERAAFLREACEREPELLAELESLLASHEQAGDFLDEPARASAEAVAPSEPVESLAGRRIGAYQLLQEIGQGGIGVVYLAVRADDEYRKLVAIKLIKRGMDTGAIVRRFRHERQMLAGLEHPNIARLIDGGTTDDGRPYFIMEYVDGLPLDEYCNRRRLSVNERLVLLRTVCGAVHFAHQNLIVHRDLKPSNILVTPDGAPKLLDFGIAKWLHPEPSAQMKTSTGLRPMTPEYASPEQVRGAAITTASDVYTLGVVLYELLTGQRPYHTEGRWLPEVERLICEAEPERPSVAVSRTKAGPEEGRAESSEALRRRLTGDLDNIILMALHKEPARRYASVQELSEDLRRHLEGRPVIARTDTIAYRGAKFIKRHKAGVLTGATMVIVVLLSAVGSTAWTSYRIEHNKQLMCRGATEELATVWGNSQKEALSAAFLATGLPYASDAVRGVNQIFDDYGRRWAAMKTEACEATHVRGGQSGELLDLRMSCLAQRREELKALARIFATADSKVVEKAVTAAQGLSDIKSCADVEALKAPLKPPADMAVRTKVEEVRLKLAHVRALNEAARYAEALPVAMQAAKDAEPLVYRPLDAETLYSLGHALRSAGEYRRSEEITLRSALAAESARHDEIAALAWAELTLVSGTLTKYDASELWAKLAMTPIERMGGNDQLLMDLLMRQGGVSSNRGRYDEAHDYYRRALALAERTNNVRTIALATNNIAGIFMRQGKNEEALQHLKRSLTLKEQVFGPMHPEIGSTLLNIGTVLVKQGQYDQALIYYQRSTENKVRNIGSEHPSLALNFRHLGIVSSLQGKHEEALRYFERALFLDEKAFGEDHPNVGDSLTGMGRAYLDLAQPEKAIPLLERALTIYQSKEVDVVRAGDTQFFLALVLTELHREPKRARALAEQARDAFKKLGGAKKQLQQVEEWLAKHFPQRAGEAAKP